MAPGSGSVNSFSLHADVLLGIGMLLFAEDLDLHSKCSIIATIIVSLFDESHAVSCVATETLKNVLKPQGSL